MTHFKFIARLRGLSLIELISTIAIVAVISSFSIPSLARFIQKSNIEQSSSELITMLAVARNNAISSGKDTYVCELIKYNECNSNRPFGAIWNQGWIVYQDNNLNGELDDMDTILTINNNKNNVGVIFNQRGRLRFRSDGSARSAGFYLCTEQLSKHILILYSGRSRVKTLKDPKKIKQCRANI